MFDYFSLTVLGFGDWIGVLLAAYNALVRIVYVEASQDVLLAQHRFRKGAVPEGAINRMMDRWEAPDLTEEPPNRAVDRWRVSGPTPNKWQEDA